MTRRFEPKSYIGSVEAPLITRSGGPLAMDAWARPKSITDISLLHGMFTKNVPTGYWKETINGVEQTVFVNATSNSGQLILQSGATLNDETILDTFRSARYEPNRGQIYSSSIFLPSPTALGERDFGMFTEENGVFFRLKSDGRLYACRRTTNNGGPTTTTTEELIPTRNLPAGFDPAMGNIYDIRMQWRGVGDISFFIGDPELGYSVEVYKMKLLNQLSVLSMSNPAVPIAYRCKNLGDDVAINSGCADLSSEGGSNEDNLYGSISIDNLTGELTLPAGTNIPALAVRNKRLIGGLRNVRDMQAYLLTAYADANAFVRVWATRDDTAITVNDQVWRDYRDGYLEFIQYDNPNVATPMTFDITKAELIFGSRVAADIPYVSTATFERLSNIHQSPGDILIFTLHHEKGSLGLAGGITYEFGEEV